MPGKNSDRRVHSSRKYEKLADNFANNLRAIRGKKTVRAFAKEIDIFPSEWNKLENGRILPSFTKLLELCDKLGKMPNELIYENHNELIYENHEGDLDFRTINEGDFSSIKFNKSEIINRADQRKGWGIPRSIAACRICERKLSFNVKYFPAQDVIGACWECWRDFVAFRRGYNAEHGHYPSLTQFLSDDVP